RKKSKYSYQYQGIKESDQVGDSWTSQRADQHGNVEDNVVPREVGGTVIGWDMFEHIVCIRTGNQCPKESPNDGHRIILPDLAGKCQQDRVNGLPGHAPAS